MCFLKKIQGSRRFAGHQKSIKSLSAVVSIMDGESQTKSYAQNIRVGHPDMKRCIIKDHLFYKQGKKTNCSVIGCCKAVKVNGACNKHCGKRYTCKFIDPLGLRCEKLPVHKGNGMCTSHRNQDNNIEKNNGIMTAGADGGEEMVMDGSKMTSSERDANNGNDTDNNEPADTMAYADGEEEMAMMGGDELDRDGDCPRRSARIKAKLDKVGDECTMVGSVYPEPYSKFPNIDLNNFGKSMHNLHFVWNE